MIVYDLQILMHTYPGILTTHRKKVTQGKHWIRSSLTKTKLPEKKTSVVPQNIDVDERT
jgi:hypothetical protein